jgi:hypothetical protein
MNLSRFNYQPRGNTEKYFGMQLEESGFNDFILCAGIAGVSHHVWPLIEC